MDYKEKFSFHLPSSDTLVVMATKASPYSHVLKLSPCLVEAWHILRADEFQSFFAWPHLKSALLSSVREVDKVVCGDICQSTKLSTDIQT